MPTGNYEFRFFANNSTTLIGTTSAISVTNAAPAPTATPTLSIVAAPASVVVPGGTVIVTWSNISSVASPGWLDWVAIYPSGNAQAAPVDWNWINCTRIPTSGVNAGLCSFTLGSIPSGSYEFRIMSNNSAIVLGTSNSFAVGQ